MTRNTLRDRLFKELLTNVLREFIEVFFPDVSAEWERDSVEFLPQEVFRYVESQECKEAYAQTITPEAIAPTTRASKSLFPSRFWFLF
ncbi:MAG: hypothetical protein ACSI46_00150 [Gloeotrichia echinulata DVL01]